MNYDLNSLNSLLNYVNRENILDYNIDPPVLTEKLRLEKAVERLDKENEAKTIHALLGELTKKNIIINPIILKIIFDNAISFIFSIFR